VLHQADSRGWGGGVPGSGVMTARGLSVKLNTKRAMNCTERGPLGIMEGTRSSCSPWMPFIRRRLFFLLRRRVVRPWSHIKGFGSHDRLLQQWGWPWWQGPTRTQPHKPDTRVEPHIRDTVSWLRARNISVGTATGYEFDDRGCIPGRYKSAGPIMPPIKWAPGASSPG
jgi:hypothetical protein